MHPRIAIALDCDGTLEWGTPPGPVKLTHLQNWANKGYIVVLISDSANCTGKWTPHHPAPRGLRHQAIEWIIQNYKPSVVYYISDNEEDEEACRRIGTGCILIRPWDNKWLNL